MPYYTAHVEMVVQSHEHQKSVPLTFHADDDDGARKFMVSLTKSLRRQRYRIEVDDKRSVPL